jgi:hypothetical protein
MMPAMALGGLLAAAQAPPLPPANPFAEAEAAAAKALALKATQLPTLSIPVAPLGFAAPSSFFLGQRYSLVSLDFLDAKHLLFTFRVPGLIHRDLQGGEAEETERQIRALVIEISSGAVQAEALWTLHDHQRYLWMLPGGHFLLRSGKDVFVSDASLQLKPLLHFPGPVLSLQPDSAGKLLVAESREPASAEKGKDASDLSMGDIRVRIVQVDTGEIVVQSRIATPRHLAIDSASYLLAEHEGSLQWSIRRMFFAGSGAAAGAVTATCAPLLDYLGPQTILATYCDTLGGHKLEALTLDGHALWEKFAPETAIWSQLTPAPGGARVARTSLLMGHPISTRNPFDPNDIRGQLVEVLNGQDGKPLLSVMATPVLDGGGNAGFSPDGNRVAVLAAGAIRIFDLAAAPKP